MNQKYLKYGFGLIATIVSFIVFNLTAHPAVAFWDCGEAAAAAFGLQVPHPPGSPFFTLMGRIFSMLPIAQNNGFRINLLSVTASAITILFLYLIIIKVIENYKGRVYKSVLDAGVTYVIAATAALGAAFSHSFWFNATESELYATNTVVFAAIIYLTMLWNEKADEHDNLKYIILIAYLIGISTTLRAFGILAILPTAMIIMFRKVVTDEEKLKKSGYLLLAHVFIVLVIAFGILMGQTSATPPSIADYKAFDLRFVAIIGIVSMLFIGIFYKYTLNRNSIYIAIFIGVGAKFLIFPGVVKYIPVTLGAVAGNNALLAVLMLVALFGTLLYLVYYSQINKNAMLQMAALMVMFIIIGYTSFSMVLVRANQDTPMNENAPKTFSELVSFLNREQYGDWPTFKRRFSDQPHQQGVFTDYSSDFDFFWKYQMNHMMTRYILWTYGGRESWEQDAGPNIAPFNQIGNVIGKPFNLKFGGDMHNSFFGIPFILGLLGLYFHFRKDWKMASAILILFIMVTYLFAFYQNQQEPQPRERDKFYAAAAFVYAIWIAVGLRSLYDIIVDKVKGMGGAWLGLTVVLLGVLFVPVRMLAANYHEHDRSKNWLPWDFAYNLLQSCEPNAILFTQGDNDTFPLWYLQDVEGYRRDVRIANLSLINIAWYPKQLKNLEPYGTPKVPLNLSDVELENTHPMEWTPTTYNLPVTAEDIKAFGVTDSAVIKNGSITWTMPPTFSSGNVNGIQYQDIMVREIVLATKFTRPIYFATTVNESSRIGLDNYLRLEGMAYRLVPYHTTGVDDKAAKILSAQLSEVKSVSKNAQRGYMFRGLNDPNLFMDDNMFRMTGSYRNIFLRLANYYTSIGEKEKAMQVLARMEEVMPMKKNSVDYRLAFNIGLVFDAAGNHKKFEEICSFVEAEARKNISKAPGDLNTPGNGYATLLEIYQRTEQYDKAIAVINELLPYYPNEPSLPAQIQNYQAMKKAKAAGKITGQPQVK